MSEKKTRKSPPELSKLLSKIDLKKYYWLISLLIFGVILLMFDGFPTTTSTSEQVEYDPVELERDYEERLIALIEQIEGAGVTKVMVTIEGTGQKVYAKIENSDEEISSTEQDTDTKTGYSTDYIIVEDENGNDTALIEKEYEPAVLGVAVLCEGGDDIGIITSVTELCEVVTGVSGNNVFVGKLA